MRDIVERLRMPDTGWAGYAEAIDVTVAEEGAAEIERLRERCEAYKGQVEAGAHEIERLRAALEVAYNGLLNGHLNDAAEMDEITARVGGALKQSDEAAWRRVAFGNEQEATPNEIVDLVGLDCRRAPRQVSSAAISLELAQAPEISEKQS